MTLIYSLVACAISIALEGVFAGGGIRQRLAQLRVPRFIPPLWGWVVIGACYYVICFVLLYRLFSISEVTALRRWTLALLFAMMSINAFWNYFFFRTRNLLHAYVIGLPYSFIAIALFLLLLQLDDVAAFVLLPYLFYLFYANRFGYQVWKLNSPSEKALL